MGKKRVPCQVCADVVILVLGTGSINAANLVRFCQPRLSLEKGVQSTPASAKTQGEGSEFEKDLENTILNFIG